MEKTSKNFKNDGTAVFSPQQKCDPNENTTDLIIFDEESFLGIKFSKFIDKQSIIDGLDLNLASVQASLRKMTEKKTSRIIKNVKCNYSSFNN